MKGKVQVNDQKHLEKEADKMGAAALQVNDVSPESIQLKQSVFLPVVQRNELEDETTNPKDDLSKLISQLNNLREQEIDPAASNKLAEAIDHINKVISSNDKELQKDVLGALHEELKDSIIESVVTNEKEDTSGIDKDKGIIQGKLELLQNFIALIGLYPKTSISLGVLAVAAIIERVIAHKKRKTLPPKLTDQLFRNNRQEYWNLVERKIKVFCTRNNFDDHDKTAITNAALTAIRTSRNQNNFLYARLPATLNPLITVPGALHKRNAQAIFGAASGNFTVSLDNEMQAATAKTINTVTVPQNQKALFTTALKKMPFVKKLYNNTIQKNLGKKENKFNAKVKGKGYWKEGGSITGNINVVDEGNRFTKARDQIDNGTFAKRVQDAERIIKQMVEPGILSQIPRPTVYVHTQNEQQVYRPWGFRAFQRDGGIHVAQDEDTSVIVHEIGHHIEHYLPMLNYQDIKLLLEGRNLDAKKASYIYNRSYEEQRYQGDYPATGKYTSKYYEGGSTEVMSMSVEYLAHPTKFKDLIEKDPQQAAIILRLLRPTEYRATNALAPFNIYLPQ
jgi:hypothetical protein